MELDFIRSMFDAIAPRYDFLNRLLSLRQDVRWRRELVRALDLPSNSAVLDVACGTGDVVLEILRQREAAVIGVDFAHQMIRIATRKIPESRSARTLFLIGDALALPIASGSVDAVTIAFGIRNIVDRGRVLAGFLDVLKPGGILAVLELNTPQPGPIRDFYLFYFQKILPSIGGIFSKNLGAYHYLPASVLNFPRPEVFAGQIREAGYTGVAWKSFTFGVATLYVGRRPA